MNKAFISAGMARHLAFNKVNTTYEDCLNNFMNAIAIKIEEYAKKGELEISADFNAMVDEFFKEVKSDDLCNTLKEVIKTKLSKLGYNVTYTNYSYSRDIILTIYW